MAFIKASQHLSPFPEIGLFSTFQFLADIQSTNLPIGASQVFPSLLFTSLKHPALLVSLWCFASLRVHRIPSSHFKTSTMQYFNRVLNPSKKAALM